MARKKVVPEYGTIMKRGGSILQNTNARCGWKMDFAICTDS